MVEAGTLCINANVVNMAGANASAVSILEAFTNVAIVEAEGFVCAQARYDYVTNYASVSTIGKEHLRMATASLAAFYVVNYDMSGFTSRQEAQVMLDALWATVVECINLLRDDKFRKFILSGVVG